jgi:chromosome segregation ATPase
MPKKKIRLRSSAEYPRRAREVPVTQIMLFGVRDELKAHVRAEIHGVNGQVRGVRAEFKRIDARFSEMEARFNKVNARFNEIDARFNEIDARFNEIDARFNEVDVRFERVEASIQNLISEVHRLAILIEEQNARNRIVLDGLTGLFARQERLEAKIDRGV